MQNKAMRDTFLEALYARMSSDKSIFLVVADFGSPVMDKIRADFPDQFFNVGIAEQNLINVATGLALEGNKVFAYAIAPFITMRCFEQIRVNISVLSTVRKMNINIIGVGAGVSYAVSGPTHHCLEDLSIMKTLPNLEVFSPSDYITSEKYVERCLANTGAKYIRLDAQVLPACSTSIDSLEKGFRVLQKGRKAALVTTGYMTHKALDVAKDYDVSIIDLYLLNRYDKEALAQELEGIDSIITAEEGFVGAGGLDAEINFNFGNHKKISNLGLSKEYTFEIGSREFVHSQSGIGKEHMKETIENVLKNQ